MTTERNYTPPPALPPCELEKVRDRAMRTAGYDADKARRLVDAYLRGRDEAEARRTDFNGRIGR